MNNDFNPATVKDVSGLLHIPHNFLFMGSPTDSFPFNIGEFGGVRVITKYRKHVIQESIEGVEVEVLAPV